MVTINGERFLTTEEAAKALGLSPGYLRNSRSVGRNLAPFITAGHAVLYREAAVKHAAQIRRRRHAR